MLEIIVCSNARTNANKGRELKKHEEINKTNIFFLYTKGEVIFKHLANNNIMELNIDDNELDDNAIEHICECVKKVFSFLLFSLFLLLLSSYLLPLGYYAHPISPKLLHITARCEVAVSRVDPT